MSGEMAASLVLKFIDQGSSSAIQAQQKIQRSFKETGTVANTASNAAMSAFRKLSTARETLGIRSEKLIQNEIRQTEAAYKRLAASGQVSARELARAQEATRGKVAQLRQELGGVRSSAIGAGNALRSAVAIAGAFKVGGMILGGPIGQTMSYDRQLANLSNTAYAGQSMDARRSGMRTLDTAVVSAVRAGGGTREAAMGTLDKLVASGAYADVAEANRLLPVLTRGGTASGADPALLADIAIRAKQTFGLTDTGLAIDQAMKAGQLGGFELKDMARWLPQQMGAARQSGLTGDAGFRTLLAANQAAAITAGTKDEAGNNIVNLLAKINSRDTAMDAKKLGIDLTGSLSAARERGVNSLDAFVNLAEQVASRDKNFGALREKAKSATGADQQATYGSMADILQGGAIGQLVQDRQAMMALVGIMNNRGYMNNVRDQLGNAKGTADEAFALVAETPSYKAELKAANQAIAMQEALDKVNPLLGKMADGISGLITDYPVLSAAVSGSALAMEALTVGALTASGALMLLGGKGAIGAGGGVGKTVASAAKKLIPSAGALRAGGIAAAPLAVMAGVSEWAGDPNETYENRNSDKSRVDSLKVSSGMVSKMLGFLGFNKEAEWEARRKKNQGEIEQPVGPPLVIENKLYLDGKQIAESVNEHNARSATRE